MPSLPNNEVKYFDSTMTGAPVLSGTPGSWVAVLNTILADGFPSVTVASLAVASDVATATVTAGHGLTMYGTSSVGPVVKIAGATPAGLNGEFRLASVPNSTTFTFATSGVADCTASGTITAQRAAAGWTKAFTGTNKAAYSRPNVAATTMLLRVDDTTTTGATIRMYETMSDIDTGTGLSTANAIAERYFYKSSVASLTARSWRAYADGRTVYFFSKADGAYWYGAMMFGDVIAYKSADVYACCLQGSTGSMVSANSQFGDLIGSAIFSRSYLGSGAAIATGLGYSHRKCSSFGDASQLYPAPADAGFHCWPVELWESPNVARGLAPGIYCPIHTAVTTMDGMWIEGANTNRLLFSQCVYSSKWAAFDVSGPWQ